VLDRAPSADDLLVSVVDQGTVTVCAQCAARRALTPEDLIPGVRIAGAAAYVEEILGDQAQALVY
jgi:predicted peroxiredoxin